MQKSGSPILNSTQDYGPFGMLMVGRDWTSGSGYRYGFNGKENDDEITGNNNAIDFGSRVYDSRLGRFFSKDPELMKYPYLSPYNYAGDNPIRFIDKQGNNIVVYYEDENGNKKPVFEIITAYEGTYTISYTWFTDYPAANSYFKSLNSPVTYTNSNLDKSINDNSTSGDAGITSIGGIVAAGPGIGVSFDFVGINTGEDAGWGFAYVTLNVGFGVLIGGGIVGGSVDYYPSSGKKFDRNSFTGISFSDTWGLFFAGATNLTSYVNADEDCFFGGCDDPVLYNAKLFGVGGSSEKVGWAHTVNHSWLMGTLFKPEKSEGAIKNTNEKDTGQEQKQPENGGNNRSYTYEIDPAEYSNILGE